MSDFPKYYRSGNKALKRISQTKAIIVRVPKGSSLYPCSMEEVDHDDIPWLDAYVKQMDEITSDDYTAYVGTFTGGARAISETLNEYKQKQFESNIKP